MSTASLTMLHVDINSYFATMLQQKYPHLRGKPVGIVKDVGRGCIIAASKEAKKLGVITGSGVKDARLKAPDIILAPAEFDFYLDATKKLKALFEEISPEVEIFSLDEAFIDISACQEFLYPDVVALGQDIQNRIKDRLGEWVSCNVGISYNRFLSKLGSEISPKGSVTVVDESNKDDYLSTTDFSSVCGVGFRLEKRLHAIGIESLYALHFVSNEELACHFEPFWVKQLRAMANGDEPHFMKMRDQNPHMKSIGRSITGFKLCDSEVEIKSVLWNLTAEVVHKLRKQGLAGRLIYLKLYGPQHQISWKKHITLKHYICHTSEMFEYLYHHLYQSWQRDFKIIKFALGLSLLKPVDQIPASLLPEHWRQEKVQTAVDALNQKHGLYTVRSGLMLNQEIIFPEVTGFLGDKLYQFM